MTNIPSEIFNKKYEIHHSEIVDLFNPHKFYNFSCEGEEI